MFFGHCGASESLQVEPQRIVMPGTVLNRCRLTEKGLARAKGMVDGQTGEVDWDVRESRSPIVLNETFRHWTGRSERVETCEGDDVFYAKVNRGRFPIWGRFVRGKQGEMVRSQTVILRPVAEEPAPVGWHVVAAYVGDPAPAFPGDPNASRHSLEYWMNHALVDGALPYDEASVTTDCPW